MSLGSGRCHYHPARPGIGICVECRSVICTECTTQFEGINRCAQCLAQKLASARNAPPRSDWSAGTLTLAVMALGALFAMVFGLATLARH